MKKFLLAVASIVLGTASAHAADLAAQYTKAPIMAPAYNWTGFYVGGNVGGQWGDSDLNTSTVFSPTGYFAASSVPAINTVGAQGVNSSSVTGGFTAGYNWQVNHAVLGLEGDINYFSFKGSATGSALYPCCAPTGYTVSSSVSADWLATIRGRIGFLAAPTWLLYATGGVAISEVKGNFNFTDTFSAATESAATRGSAGPRASVPNTPSAAAGRSRPNISTSISAAPARPAPIWSALPERRHFRATSTPTRSISSRTSCASA